LCGEYYCLREGLGGTGICWNIFIKEDLNEVPGSSKQYMRRYIEIKGSITSNNLFTKLKVSQTHVYADPRNTEVSITTHYFLQQMEVLIAILGLEILESIQSLRFSMMMRGDNMYEVDGGYKL